MSATAAHSLPHRGVTGLAEGTRRVLTDFFGSAAIMLVGVSLMPGNIVLAFGLAVVATLAIAILAARMLPALILFSLLFQNSFVAFMTGMVDDTSTFDTMRALNFVILMTAFGSAMLSTILQPQQYSPEVRRYVRLLWLTLALIMAYLTLGLAVGNGRDAIIYFRNLCTPLACFYVALVCGYRFRVALLPTAAIFMLAIILYGYCELFFTTSFLSLFNGDRYIYLRMYDEILSGAFQKQMEQTGFVLRGIQDYMTVPLFNLTGAGEDAIRIFRLSGPNFHPISYGYALSILGIWCMAQGVLWLPLLALPVMIFVGAKGALVLFFMFTLMYVGTRIIRPRQLLLPFIGILVAYVIATTILGIRSQDYHVLGLMSGLREFFSNPAGHGLGSGGIVSAQGQTVDWQAAQASGATTVPVESTVGVLLYQMGIAAFAIFGAVLALGRRCWIYFLQTRSSLFVFGFVAPSVITANAFFQEEAYFAPLSLGLCMLLVGALIGSTLRQTEQTEDEASAHQTNGPHAAI
jgi:hypothetical protein